MAFNGIAVAWKRSLVPSQGAASSFNRIAIALKGVTTAFERPRRILEARREAPRAGARFP